MSNTDKPRCEDCRKILRPGEIDFCESCARDIDAEFEEGGTFYRD